MLSQGLLYFNDISLTVLGMIIFFTSFIGIATWTIFRSAAKEYYKKAAAMPLRDEE